MATWEDERRWWIVPGEVVTTIGEGSVPVLFEYDDGTIWGFRIGEERVLWDHTASALVLAPKMLGAAAMQKLRDALAAMGAPHPGWGVTPAEQAVIDKLALGLAEGRWMTGRRLRHTLNITAEDLAAIKRNLLPRYLAEDHGDKGDYYSLTLPGLLRSGEKSRVEAVIGAALAVIRAKFNADPDIAGFSTDEVIAEGHLDQDAGAFIDGVLFAAWLYLGGNGGGQGHALRMNYGMPKDIEDIAKCSSVGEFMKMLRQGRNSLRAWPTAPMRVLQTASAADLPHGNAVPSVEVGMKYDVTLSFAGEDRAHAEALAERLRESGIKVFYDLYEQATLWGKDLYEHLHSVYSEQATYCVLFVSEHYAKKLWTTHERKAAQERAFKERGGEYILPIRLDTTRLPGLAETIGYVGIEEGIDRIAEMLLAKLRVRGGMWGATAAGYSAPPTAPSKAEGQGSGAVPRRGHGGDTFHITASQVQIGDHNVQNQAVADQPKPMTGGGHETTAGLIGIYLGKLSKHRAILIVVVLIVAAAGVAYSLATWGPPIKGLFKSPAGGEGATPTSPSALPVRSPPASAAPLTSGSSPPTLPASTRTPATAAAVLPSPAMSDTKGPTFNINAPGGQVQVGDHNTQNMTVVAPRARDVSQATVDALVSALQSKPAHKFAVVTGFDHDSTGVGKAIFQALTRAKWSAGPIIGPPNDAGNYSVNQVMPTPARRGVTVFVKKGSQETSAPEILSLLQWCQQAGLQPGPVGSDSLELDKQVDVLIEVGDPP